jgi:hypothetical protein
MFAVYGDNLFQKSEYTIEVVPGKINNSEIHNEIQALEAEIVKKKEEMALFQVFYLFFFFFCDLDLLFFFC